MRASRGAAPAGPSPSRAVSYSRPPLFPTRPRPLAVPRCPSRAALLSTRRVQRPQLGLPGLGPRTPGMPGPAGGRRRPRGRRWARARVGGGCSQTPRHQGSSPGTRRSHFPQFFFPGKLSWAVPGVGVGGGASKFPLQTGKLTVPPPRPSPPRRRGAPPTTGAGRSQGGTATGSGTRTPKPTPRPGAPREGPPRPAPGQPAVLSKKN